MPGPSGPHNPCPEAEHRSRLRALTFCVQRGPDRHALHGCAGTGQEGDSGIPESFPYSFPANSQKPTRMSEGSACVWTDELAHDPSGEVNREG